MVALVQAKTGNWSDPSSVTLDAAPTDGNLLIALISERSGTAATAHTITGSGWTVAVEDTIEQGDSTYRRSISIHYKEAGASESATITADDGTGNAKEITVAEYELEGDEDRWEFIEAISNDDGTTADGGSIASGSTSSLSADPKVIIGVAIAKNGSYAYIPSTTWTAGYTEDHESDYNSNQMLRAFARKNTESSGTESATFTLEAAGLPHNGLHIALLAFKTGSNFIRQNFSGSSNGSDYMGGGSNRAPAAILIDGDSIACGAGGGVNQILDRTKNNIWSQVESGTAVLVDTTSTPFITHDANGGADEVGIDLPFCDQLAEGDLEYRKVIALGCGKSGSGNSTGDYNNVSGAVYLEGRNLANIFYENHQFGELKAMIYNNGTNDTNDYSDVSSWSAISNTHITETRDGTRITGLPRWQPDLNIMPIVFNGIPPDYIPADAGKLALQAEIEDMPNQGSYRGYANITGCQSQPGDDIHTFGADARQYSKGPMVTAYESAKTDT